MTVSKESVEHAVVAVHYQYVVDHDAQATDPREIRALIRWHRTQALRLGGFPGGASGVLALVWGSLAGAGWTAFIVHMVVHHGG